MLAASCTNDFDAPFEASEGSRAAASAGADDANAGSARRRLPAPGPRRRPPAQAERLPRPLRDPLAREPPAGAPPARAAARRRPAHRGRHPPRRAARPPRGAQRARRARPPPRGRAPRRLAPEPARDDRPLAEGTPRHPSSNSPDGGSESSDRFPCASGAHAPPSPSPAPAPPEPGRASRRQPSGAPSLTPAHRGAPGFELPRERPRRRRLRLLIASHRRWQPPHPETDAASAIACRKSRRVDVGCLALPGERRRQPSGPRARVPAAAPIERDRACCRLRRSFAGLSPSSRSAHASLVFRAPGFRPRLAGAARPCRFPVDLWPSWRGAPPLGPRWSGVPGFRLRRSPATCPPRGSRRDQP